MKDLPEDVAFTGRMIMDAALFGPPPAHLGSRGRPRKVGKRLPSPGQIVKRAPTAWESASLNLYGREVDILVVSFTALWYSVTGSRPVRVVVTGDPKDLIEERAYFSTDTSLTPGDVLVHNVRRWELEVTFRNGKQVMGIEDPQNGWWRRPAGSLRPKKRAGPNPKGRRGEKAVLHTFSLAMVVYDLVALWYFEYGDPAGDVARVRREAPWYVHKVEPSFMDMLASIRREIWGERFFADPELARVAEKLRDYLPQAMLAS